MNTNNRGKWIIDKVIGEFDYGHNVWTQELDNNLSCGSTCKCKWRHGHRGKVVIYVTADDLISSQNSMIIDFNNLKILTYWIDNTLDHKYIVDIHDPANFDTFSHIWDNEKNSFKENSLIKKDEGHWLINPREYENLPEPLKIKYQSYVIVDFVPTAENLAKWMHDVAVMKFKETGIKVHKIVWYETPKSRATYYGV